MASRFKNIAKLLGDLKSRTIIIVTAMIIIFGVVIGFLNYKRELVGPTASSQVESVPSSLKAIPGQQNQNIEYAKLQEKENLEKVERAFQRGTSAIPTIIQTTANKPLDQESSQEPENVHALALVSVKQGNCNRESLQNAKRAGVTASELQQLGCTADQLRVAGYSASDLLKAGFSLDDLKGLGYGLDALRNAGVCSCDLKHAGYTAVQLKQAGFSAADLKCACFTDDELAQAGFPPGANLRAMFAEGCDPDNLAKARAQGASPVELRRMGCSAIQLQQLGLTASELKLAGYAPEELKAAGFTAGELLAAGYTPQQLKQAGYSVQDLRNAGVSAKELKDLGYSAQQLKEGGFSELSLKDAGYTPAELVQAGITPGFATADSFGSPRGSIPDTVLTADVENQQIAALAAQQQQQISAQQLKQSQQEMQTNMQGQAQQLFGKWTAIANQSLVMAETDKDTAVSQSASAPAAAGGAYGSQAIMTKAGTVMFAILDTAVNSDEPGPVMATIVEGKFKGGKLLGLLQVFGRDADRVMLTFNKLILPDMPKSMGVNALAIDPNTARTALSSYTDHHYLLRYGSLFASSFLQGYGQAVMQSGSIDINRDTTQIRQTKEFGDKELAAAGLGQVGMTWGSQLGNIFNRPPTIHVYAGTSVGILFQDDVQSTQ